MTDIVEMNLRRAAYIMFVDGYHSRTLATEAAWQQGSMPKCWITERSTSAARPWPRRRQIMRMVEKVAMRLWASENVLSLGTYSADDFAWHVTPYNAKVKYMMQARTAIEAMRVPTSDMLISASSVSVSDNSKTYHACGPLVSAISDALVTAALADGAP